jgi:hypothetical protein
VKSSRYNTIYHIIFNITIFYTSLKKNEINRYERRRITPCLQLLMKRKNTWIKKDHYQAQAE